MLFHCFTHYINSMKAICLILLCIACNCSFCQSDSIIVQTGPGLKRKLERVVIVNGFLITDTAKATILLKSLEGVITKRKLYSDKESFRRWGIMAPDGILFYQTKKNVIIDAETMKQIKKTD